LISVAIGALVGGAASLWGVRIVQDRTDLREHRRVIVEDERERRKLESEKPSRLRPDRISLLYEVGNFLRTIDGSLEILFDRSEDDDTHDWVAVAAEAATHFTTARQMDIQVRLLFQSFNLVQDWDALHRALSSLDQAVEFGDQWVAPGSIILSDEEERKHWALITEAAREVSAAATRTAGSLRRAMARIDTE
jgi:hypothetical protein